MLNNGEIAEPGRNGMLGAVVDIRPKREWRQDAAPAPRRRRGRQELYADGGVEPAIEDLLNDPVTAAIMRCDRVNPVELRVLVDDVRVSLRSR
jgi:hypothetical protein